MSRYSVVPVPGSKRQSYPPRINVNASVFFQINRPRKSEFDKSRRRKVQIRRIVRLGVPEASLTKLNSKESRGMQRHLVKAATAATAKKAEAVFGSPKAHGPARFRALSFFAA